MKLAKHSLIIDGNYFLHSRLFVLPNKKDEILLSSEKSQKDLMRKLSIDLAAEVRKMSSFIDQVVVAVDAKSWRKDLFPEAQYKGTRTLDSSIDWNAVFNVYEEWQKILAKQGVIVHQINGAEADDVLFGWSTQLNNQGKNCIVWTGDRDLIQLVNYNQAMDAYTLWYYNSKKSLFAFKGFNDVLKQQKANNISNDELLFNMANDAVLHDKMVEDMKDFIQKDKVNITEVNCDEFIFTKILQGDTSDNIKSVATWTKTTKSGKILNCSITEKMATKVLQQFIKENKEFTTDMFFNKDMVAKMADVIHRVIKKHTLKEIKQRLNQNIDLMLLHYNTIPDAIQKEIYKNVEQDLNQKPNFKVISKMDSILADTKWKPEKGSGAPKSFDPFAHLNKKTKTKKAKVKSVTKNKPKLF